MIAKKPLSPVDRFIQHTVFATEFDAANNLDMYGRYLNTFQYYSLDVILPLLLVLIIVTSLILFCSVKCLRCALAKRHKKKVE